VAATLLIGKHKPQFTSHIDCGDYIIVINAKDLIVTGNKLQSKMYYSHSGYPGALKERSLSEQLDRDPTVVIFHAIRGMLPVNRLRDDRLARLKIYVDGEHKHEAQKPEVISVKGQK
jgi:large subunit ribosomal protein L13